LANGATETMWVDSILKELGVTHRCTPVLFCGLSWGYLLTANPVFHARAKHIEIDFHFVHERVKAMHWKSGLFPLMINCRMNLQHQQQNRW
jgi:hypothetical protein